MQRFLDLFVQIALHVSGGSSFHHQEDKTVHTASGIVKPILLPAASRGVTFTLQMNTCPLITLFGIPRNLRTSIGSQ